MYDLDVAIQSEPRKKNGAIEKAGEWLREGWSKDPSRAAISFDDCMDVLCGFGYISSSGYTREQILAEGFLDAFYGV